MATTFNSGLGRSVAADKLAREIPEVVVRGIIDDIEKTSVALQLGEVHRMSAYQERYRLVNSFPSAYWLNGTAATDKPGSGMTGNSFTDGTQAAKDYSLKQTTSYGWDNLTLVPDELAVMVVMPDAWRDDSDIAWEEIRSKVRGAFAASIDAAVLYGKSLTSHPLPTSFGVGVIPATISKGLVVNEGFEPGGGTFGTADTADLADDYAQVAQELEERGYNASSYIVGAAETWRLRRLRVPQFSGDTSGAPLVAPVTDGGPLGLWGIPLREVSNGIWDKTVATALVGDWSQLHIGVRQDMQFTMSNSAIITDQSANVVYNAYQQDGEILRVCMRLGYLVTDPIRNLTGSRQWPFQVLVPRASTAS